MIDSQLAFDADPTIAAHGSAWCTRSISSDGGVWDGVDWDRCFRARCASPDDYPSSVRRAADALPRSVFDGVVPLVFLSLSVSLLLVKALRAAFASLARSKESYIRLATEDAPAESVPSPIAQAEASVLRQVAEKQSPDWRNPTTQRDLLGVYVDAADDRLLEEVTPTRGGIAVVLRAVWGSKKDVLNVVGAAAMTALCSLKLVRALQARADGRGWVIMEPASWVRL